MSVFVRRCLIKQDSLLDIIPVFLYSWLWSCLLPSDDQISQYIIEAFSSLSY